MHQERVSVLLYCPAEGGWHTGLWWDGAWRLQYDIQQVLTPTHWLPVPHAVAVDQGRSAESRAAA
jgi:hypothetical protein